MGQVALERQLQAEQAVLPVLAVQPVLPVSQMPEVMVRVQMLRLVMMPWRQVIRVVMAVPVAVARTAMIQQAVQMVAVALFLVVAEVK